jgi:predicted acyltransferase
MSTVAPPVPASERLMALDVFRGITIAGMLLVNNPGSWGAIYPPLEHAPWNGWTPTDLIFPFFLFIVGVTTHLSLSHRDPNTLTMTIIRRGLLIVLAGLLLNAFPFFWWGKMAGIPDPTFLQRVLWRAQHLRFMGVLQRIGFAYIAAGLLTIRTTVKQQIAIIVALLLGYWFVMTLVPVPGTGTIGYFLLDQPERTLAAWSDRLILGTNHIWASTKTWDPEGPLSTIPAIATAMLGILAGRWLTDKRRPLLERIAGLFGAGCLGMVAGELWSWVFPINKNLWTSSYVVFTAGFACVVLATCLWILDVREKTAGVGSRESGVGSSELRPPTPDSPPPHQIPAWARPFIVYGVNPLVAFVGSGIMARCIDSLFKITIEGKKTSLHQASFDAFFAPYFPDKFASLLWGLAFVAVWLAILWLLHRRNIIVKL